MPSKTTLALSLALAFLAGCGKKGPFVETLLGRRDLAIYLQKTPRGSYDHPKAVDPKWLSQLFSAVHFAPARESYPLFPPRIAQRLSEAVARGLKRARSDEVVSFVWVMPAPSFRERLTSGGVFVLGDELHLVVANIQVPIPLWEGAEEERVPSYFRPLEPIEPQMGRLALRGAFKWREVPFEASGFRSPYYGDAPWHVAIRIEPKAAGEER